MVEPRSHNDVSIERGCRNATPEKEPSTRIMTGTGRKYWVLGDRKGSGEEGEA